MLGIEIPTEVLFARAASFGNVIVKKMGSGELYFLPKLRKNEVLF